MPKQTDKQLLTAAFFSFITEVTDLNPSITLFDLTEVLGEVQNNLMKKSVEKAAQDVQLESRG